MSDGSSPDSLGLEPEADWPPDDVRQRLEALRPGFDALKSTLPKLLIGYGNDGYYVVQLYSELAAETASLGARANRPETFLDRVFVRRADEHFKFLILLRIAIAEWTLKAIEECGPKPFKSFLANDENLRNFKVKLNDVIEEALRGVAQPATTQAGGAEAPKTEAEPAPKHDGPDSHPLASGDRLQTRGRRGRPRSKSNLHPEVEPYLEEVSKAVGRPVTIREFCQVSGFADDTVFGFWRQGNTVRCTAAHEKAFQRTLRLSPQVFLQSLSQSQHSSPNRLFR